MPKISFNLNRRFFEDQTAPRRPPDVVLQVAGGGSPFGSTRYKRTRLCPFEDAMVSIAKLRPLRDKEPLTVGWILHQCWEAYYQVIRDHQAKLGAPPKQNNKPKWEHYFFGGEVAAEKAGLAVLEQFAEEPGYLETMATCGRVFQAYCEFYRRRFAWRIVAVEETIIVERPVAQTFGKSLTLVDQDGDKISYETWRYSARLDLVIERWDIGDPALWIVEHKTAKILSEDLLHGYQLDMQILGQVWLMQNAVDLSMYAPFRGVMVNIATKHATPKFERLEVCPSVDHLLEFERSTQQWGLMNEVFKAMGHPRALGACAGALRGYAKCAYYECCHGKPNWTIEDFKKNEPLDGFYREDRPYISADDFEDYA
jgi:hypothetical protein